MKQLYIFEKHIILLYSMISHLKNKFIKTYNGIPADPSPYNVLVLERSDPKEICCCLVLLTTLPRCMM